MVAGEAEPSRPVEVDTRSDDPGPGGGSSIPRGARSARSRQPEIEQISVKQGHQATFSLGTSCPGETTGRLNDGDQIREDLDDEPDRFTFAADFDVGTHLVDIACGSQPVLRHQLMVFRQTGARRGGATSVVTGTAVGLGSALLLIGLPEMLAPIGRRHRRRQGVDHRHSSNVDSHL